MIIGKFPTLIRSCWIRGSFGKLKHHFKSLRCNYTRNRGDERKNYRTEQRHRALVRATPVDPASIQSLFTPDFVSQFLTFQLRDHHLLWNGPVSMSQRGRRICSTIQECITHIFRCVISCSAGTDHSAPEREFYSYASRNCKTISITTNTVWF